MKSGLFGQKKWAESGLVIFESGLWPKKVGFWSLLKIKVGRKF